jgi:uncharacterized protein YgiM (DUF1202 family)
MPKLTVKKRLQIMLIIFLVGMTGIVFSTLMIDNIIDDYIDRMSTDIHLEVINNYENVNVDVKKDDENISIYINPKNERMEEEVKVFEPTEAIVSSEVGINIRKEPSVDSEKIGVVPYGCKITILDEEGDWYKINSGYVYKEYVDIEFNN